MGRSPPARGGAHADTAGTAVGGSGAATPAEDTLDSATATATDATAGRVRRRGWRRRPCGRRCGRAPTPQPDGATCVPTGGCANPLMLPLLTVG